MAFRVFHAGELADRWQDLNDIEKLFTGCKN